MSITPTEQRDSLTARVAEEIRALMARKRITGAALARMLDVSQMWVSYRLNGRQPIDLNDLARIADALGVGVVDLLPRDQRTGVTVTELAPVGHAHSPMRNGAPASGRPPGRGDRSRPPSGPRRTSRVPRHLTA